MIQHITSNCATRREQASRTRAHSPAHCATGLAIPVKLLKGGTELEGVEAIRTLWRNSFGLPLETPTLRDECTNSRRAPAPPPVAHARAARQARPWRRAVSPPGAYLQAAVASSRLVAGRPGSTWREALCSAGRPRQRVHGDDR